MAYLYYVDLGNKGSYDVNGNPQLVILMNTGPFTNLYTFSYWSGTKGPLFPGGAWFFDFALGSQNLVDEAYSGNDALAVHSGDVGGSVPISAAILLFAPGLAGIVALKRRIGVMGQPLTEDRHLRKNL